MTIQSIRGMNDIASPEIQVWQFIESRIRSVYSRFGYSEIRTPIVELTALFKRGVGSDTDIVEKEMYSFEDRSGDHISLRPEGTAAVVRAVIEHNWLRDNPVSKFYYIGPMFRHERPQKGRYRQFYQYGLEYFGVPTPWADVEVIECQNMLYDELNLKSKSLRLSSVGCAECRGPYKQKLIALLESKIDQVPEDFKPRVHTNPQRIFDHKSESAQKLSSDLPFLLDSLCANCKEHFEGVKKGLSLLNIPFEVDPRIVRGLDYYNRTAFEFTSADLGAQSAIGGGGRYDNLVAQLGGKETPAVGFAGGMERLVLLLGDISVSEGIDAFVAFADPVGQEPSYLLAQKLRMGGAIVETEHDSRSIKSQFKRADKLKSKFVIVIGAREVENKTVTLKNMSTQEQTEVSSAGAIEKILSDKKARRAGLQI